MKRIDRLLRGSYAGMIAATIIICLFMTAIQTTGKKQFLLPNICSLAVGIVIFAIIFAGLCLLHRHVSERAVKRVIIGLSIASAFYLYYISRLYCFSTSWDSGTVLENARYLAAGEREHVNSLYYSWYPSNITLTAFYALLLRLGTGEGYFVILFMQCVIFAASGLLIYLAANRLSGSRCGAFTWVIYMLLVGHSPWIVIPYSDAMGLIFTSAMAYCSTLRGRGYLRIVLTVFLSVFGYFIKPQLLIFGMAFVIINIRELFGVKPMIAAIAASAAALCAAGAIKAASGIDTDPQQRIGMAHYLMTGLNPERHGIFDPEDAEFSQGFATNRERDEADMKRAAERVRNAGAAGLLELAIHKTLINYNDGTFAWWVEGAFFGDRYTDTDNAPSRLLRELYYRDGKYYKLFHTVMQMLWLAALLLGALAAKCRDRRIAVLMLAIIGLTLFELLFEARARYLFAYAPIYIMLASAGLNVIIALFKEREKCSF